MRSLNHAVTTVVVGLLACVTTACGGDEPEQGAPMVREQTPGQSGGAAAEQAPRWRKDYSQEQLAAYREARQRWAAYTRRSEPVWARGRATPEARELFEEFFFQPDLMFSLLESHEQRDITVRGRALVLSTRPLRVDLGDPTTVVIRQCIDARGVELLSAGTLVTDPGQEPTVRRIVLSRTGGEPFVVVAYKGPETGDKAACR